MPTVGIRTPGARRARRAPQGNGLPQPLRGFAMTSKQVPVASIVIPREANADRGNPYSGSAFNDEGDGLPRRLRSSQ